MSKPVIDDLFSFEGRRNRKSFIFYNLALFGVSLLVIMLMGLIASMLGSVGSVLVVVAVVWGLAAGVSSLAVTTQRIRDIGYSGWWVLGICAGFMAIGAGLFLLIGPQASFVNQLLSVIYGVALMAVPGAPGETRFGPDPLD